MQVGEVGAPAARNADFLPHLRPMVEDQRPAPALVRFHGAHQASRPGADDDDFEILHARGVAEAPDAAKPVRAVPGYWMLSLDTTIVRDRVRDPVRDWKS